MLVVDDERVITFALSSYFTEIGFSVDIASEREEALALLMHSDYDVVIADLRLTGTTGEEGLDVIRVARQRSSSISIILLSAYRTAAIDAEALSAGVDALLQKPRPLSELAKTVYSLLESR